jgi:hypothetical protein
MSQVGHTSSKMTIDVYGQLMQRIRRQHGINFDRLVRNARHAPAQATQGSPAAA